MPHIIRKNRNAVAVLSGSENNEQIAALGEDVFSYFGMGCRNVSKIFIPENFDVKTLLEAWHQQYKSLILHNKYKNNFDYYSAVYLLNRESFLSNGSLLMREQSAIASPIANLHYEYYSDLSQVKSILFEQRDEIQCIASEIDLATEIPIVKFGQSQKPGTVRLCRRCGHDSIFIVIK